MTSSVPAGNPQIAARTEVLYREYRAKVHRGADQVIACLLLVQWIACIAIALWLSPLTWIGQKSLVHEHVYAAILLGGIIMLPPAMLGLLRPGHPATCYCIAIGQMLASALLIHLTGGRIESHFHVFGSLAFLAYYRDWRVIVVASAVVAADHFVRGVFWPQSVFGVAVASHWRWLEHAWWVVFEDIFLIIGGVRSLQLLRDVAHRSAELEVTKGLVEQAVVERTAQLASANRSLHAELEERTRVEEDLKAAKETADAASRAKSQFLANMSHEVRTPLNGMLGMSQLLLDTPLSEKQRACTETFKRCTESLAGVLDDVLDFSNLDTHSLKVARQPFSLRAAVNEALHLHARSGAAKNLKLTCAVSETLPDQFLGDGARVRQIVSNLVSNGVKFTEQGEVAVSVEPGDAKLETCASQIVLIVRDTGIGIPAERLPHIFHAFEQLDNSMTRRFSGTGLGLTIVQRLVELMRGTVSVTSEVGRGSTFRVTLALERAGTDSRAADHGERATHTADSPTIVAAPAVELADEKNETSSSRESGAAIPLTVLLAEDNDVNRAVARRFLEKLGYGCDEAQNGAEALAACERSAYDLVLMDVQMPVMDGYQATREIIARHGERRPQIVALTAHASEADRRACLDCGMDDFMTKPIHPGVLEEKIGAAIARRRHSAMR